MIQLIADRLEVQRSGSIDDVGVALVDVLAETVSQQRRIFDRQHGIADRLCHERRLGYTGSGHTHQPGRQQQG